jgi:hypothetical protein
MNQSSLANTLSLEARIWARVRRQGAHILRRGAWYNVLREPKDGLVLLEVNKEIVPMNEQFVVLTREKPKKWSVVSRDPMDYGARRASMERRLEATYAVCPHCRARANIHASTVDCVCPKCQGTYEVDWGDPC